MKSRFTFLERKYLSLTIVVGLLFIYVLVAEVYDRYSNTLSFYQTLREKESTILDPVFLKKRETALTAERDSLSGVIQNERSAYPQNQIGVIQCVTGNARLCQVTIGSFNPGSVHVAGQFEAFDFGLSTRSRFSQAGLLVNKLENETIPFDITKVQMISSPVGTGYLQMNLEVKAYLYHGIH